MTRSKGAVLDAPPRYRNLAGFLKGTHTSRAKLAREFGVSPSLVASWVNGRTEPDLDTAMRLVVRCKIPLESLIRRKVREAKARAAMAEAVGESDVRHG